MRGGDARTELKAEFLQVEANSQNMVGLSGYGVELAIKNTEYKAIDDTKIDKNEEEDNETADFYGFDFKTLRYSRSFCLFV